MPGTIYTALSYFEISDPQLKDLLTQLGPYGVLGAILAVLIWAASKVGSGLLQEIGKRLPDWIRRPRAWTERAILQYAKRIALAHGKHAIGFFPEDAPDDVNTVYIALQWEDEGRRVDIVDTLRALSRAVVLGDPGAGKSMLLKRMLLNWAEHPTPDTGIPVLVDLHLFSRRGGLTLHDLILDELGEHGLLREARLVTDALTQGRLRLLLDGLDEVPADVKANALADIKAMATTYPDCPMFVTCRVASYQGELSPEFGQVVRIAELDDASMRQLLRNLHGGADDLVEILFATLHRSPPVLGLARTPLMLTMIHYLFKHRVFGDEAQRLPTSRTQFYKLAVDYLLRRDQAMARLGLSKFDSADKAALLQRVAIELLTITDGQASRRSMPWGDLLALARSLLPNLNMQPDRAEPLVREVVDRTGILVAYESAMYSFGFRHLTMQEYLAAVELIAAPNKLLEYYFADRGAWRETVKMSCGLASYDCAPLIRQILDSSEIADQVLAMDCLAEARNVDQEFADTVVDRFLARLGGFDAWDDDVVSALGAVTAGDGPRARRTFAALSNLADFATGERHVLAVRALAASGRQEAADFLSRRMGEDDASRQALLSMGELAIPVLRKAALAGTASAIDDLGAIGTPSAAIALLQVLPGGDPSAGRAAWWIAALMHSGDVMDVLRREATEVELFGPRLDWIGTPYRDDWPVHLQRIAGRVGWLIKEYPDEGGALSSICTAIGLPLAVVVESVRSGRLMAYRKGTDVHRLAPQVAREVGVDLRRGGYWIDRSEVRDIMVAAADREASPEAAELVRAVLEGNASIPALSGRLISLLDWPVQARAAGYLAFPVPRAVQKDWTTVAAPLKATRGPRFAAAAVGGLVLLAVLGIGGYRMVMSTAGAGPWGPGWLSWTGIGLTSTFLLTLGLGLVLLNRDANDLAITALSIVVAAAGLGAVGALAVYAAATLSDWIGWPLFVVVTAAFVVIQTLLVAVVSRRSRALSNPVRGAFNSDPRAIPRPRIPQDSNARSARAFAP